MSGERSPDDQYIWENRKRYIRIFIALLVTIVISIWSFGVGSELLNFDIAMNIIRDRIDGEIPDRSVDYWAWLRDRLVIEGTIPRAIGGIFIGAILGISGAVMQMCVRNPLASPYTTGISSAALFGVTVYIVAGYQIIPGSDELSLIVNAFVFSMVPCAVMIMLSVRSKVTPTLLVLIGIGVMYLFNAFTQILKYRAEHDDLARIQEWSVGSIAELDWVAVQYVFFAFLFLIITMYYFSRKLDVMTMGENMSQSLGINPSRLRIICMVIISGCTSVAVCFAGTIGFVGLVIPHVSRLLVGSKCKNILPCSAVLGALLLVGSDVLSRFLNLQLPVGAVTAAIGAPIFLYFLFKIRSNGWGR